MPGVITALRLRFKQTPSFNFGTDLRLWQRFLGSGIKRDKTLKLKLICETVYYFFNLELVFLLEVFELIGCVSVLSS